MRLLVAAQMCPHPEHSTRAANVVLFEMLKSLAGTRGMDVLYLPVLPEGWPARSAVESAAATSLEAHGVRVLEPLLFPAEQKLRVNVPGFSLVDGSVERFYPATKLRAAANKLVSELAPDAVMTVWSEQATAMLSESKALRFAYYGNPDMKAGLARARFNRRHGGSLKDYVVGVRSMALLERVHLREMLKWHLHGNVAANDARYYADRGHPNAFYIRNLWIDRTGPPRFDTPPRTGRPAKIVASIGKVNGTANTHGLEYLATAVLPELRRQLSKKPFELHVFGTGKPAGSIAPLLAASEIRVRGFVEDIDTELKDADVFLCTNNATAYNVGHTRYLHAWSLGCCVVAAEAVREAMPELVHRENALLGRDAAGVAAAVVEAVHSPELRRDLGQNGYETFKTLFTAPAVAKDIIHRLQGAAAR